MMQMGNLYSTLPGSQKRDATPRPAHGSKLVRHGMSINRSLHLHLTSGSSLPGVVIIDTTTTITMCLRGPPSHRVPNSGRATIVHHLLVVYAIVLYNLYNLYSMSSPPRPIIHHSWQRVWR